MRGGVGCTAMAAPPAVATGVELRPPAWAACPPSRPPGPPTACTAQGAHTLTCTASYVAPGGERRSQAQAFHFAALNPLTVRTKASGRQRERRY